MTQPQVLSDEQIEQLAHRTCSRRKHATQPSYVEYVFKTHTLGDFARAIESATIEAVRGQVVAWMSTDSIGERYLCFSKPADDDAVTPLCACSPTQPPVQAERAPVDMEKARAAFEAISKDSHDHKRSVRGTYRNPPVARDWKWFQLGIYHATEGTK